MLIDLHNYDEEFRNLIFIGGEASSDIDRMIGRRLGTNRNAEWIRETKYE